MSPPVCSHIPPASHQHILLSLPSKGSQPLSTSQHPQGDDQAELPLSPTLIIDYCTSLMAQRPPFQPFSTQLPWQSKTRQIVALPSTLPGMASFVRPAGSPGGLHACGGHWPLFLSPSGCTGLPARQPLSVAGTPCLGASASALQLAPTPLSQGGLAQVTLVGWDPRSKTSHASLRYFLPPHLSPSVVANILPMNYIHCLSLPSKIEAQRGRDFCLFIHCMS